MARSTDGAVAEAEASADVAENESDRASVMFSVPKAMKEQLEKAAEADNDKSVSSFVREHIARIISFELPPMAAGRRSRYSNDEERQAAQKQSYEKRKSTIKALLEAYKRGEIQLPASEATNTAPTEAEAVTA